MRSRRPSLILFLLLPLLPLFALLPLLGCTAASEDSNATSAPLLESTSRGEATSRDETTTAVRSRFPRDATEMLDALGGVASANAARYAALMDLLRTDRPEASRLLDEALLTARGNTPVHRQVLFAMGEVAHDGSLDDLERELSYCTGEVRSLRTRREPPPRRAGRVRRRCEPVHGDLPDSCFPESHPEFFGPTAQLQATQVIALDAFDRIGYRYRSTAVGRRFFATLNRVLDDPDCGPSLRETAALYYIERSPNSRAARRELMDRFPADEQFADLRWVSAFDTRAADRDVVSRGTVDRGAGR